jgi:hypothetical protein
MRRARFVCKEIIVFTFARRSFWRGNNFAKTFGDKFNLKIPFSAHGKPLRRCADVLNQKLIADEESLICRMKTARILN